MRMEQWLNTKMLVLHKQIAILLNLLEQKQKYKVQIFIKKKTIRFSQM